MERLNRLIQQHSVASSVAAGFCFGGLGDVVAQVTEGGAYSDFKRTALVGSYYGGAAVVFWHPLYAWMDRAFKTSVAKKVIVDNFVVLPVVDIPAFYLCTLSPRFGLEEAMMRLQADYSTSVLSGWALWVPTTTAVFAYSPAHLRLPIFFAVDTLWAGALSIISNRQHGRQSASKAAVPAEDGDKSPPQHNGGPVQDFVK